MSLKRRLATRSKPGPNGCIDFVGAKHWFGYGRLRIGGRKGRAVLAHNVAYEAYWGPIPRGKRVLHECDRPICINPAHLKLGTHRDNMRDMTSRGRSGRKVTAKDIPRIRADTRLQRDIADDYGISQVMVSRIKLRKAWKHVP